MPVIHKVVAKVISQTGRCGAEHKVGDEWVLGSKTPEGICNSAYLAMNSKAFLLRSGAPMQRWSWIDFTSSRHSMRRLTRSAKSNGAKQIKITERP